MILEITSESELRRELVEDLRGRITAGVYPPPAAIETAGERIAADLAELDRTHVRSIVHLVREARP